MLTDEEGKFLLKVARNAIKKFVNGERADKPDEYPEALNAELGVFCTLNKKGKLRGCIGMPYPVMPLIKAVISSACSACEDPRFKKLSKNELGDIKIEVSVLTEPKLIEVEKPDDYLKQIEPKKHGLILQYGPYSGLFLPQVWEDIPDKTEFLDNLCIKAGMTPGMWKERDIKIYSFEAQIFEEK
ncbi:MAG: AmmeMemoRadiSam system protein A [Candidatus Aenigmarchaeota archaeon]|nr:AmmeMemoRadiSam system protein A [Candidatus Aenigmarchaeota archaeon]